MRPRMRSNRPRPPRCKRRVRLGKRVRSRFNPQRRIPGYRSCGRRRRRAPKVRLLRRATIRLRDSPTTANDVAIPAKSMLGPLPGTDLAGFRAERADARGKREAQTRRAMHRRSAQASLSRGSRALRFKRSAPRGPTRCFRAEGKRPYMLTETGVRATKRPRPVARRPGSSKSTPIRCCRRRPSVQPRACAWHRHQRLRR